MNRIISATYSAILFFCDRSILTIVYILFFSSTAFTQVTPPETDVNHEQQLENTAQSAGEDVDLSELEEQRNYYQEHPIDINNAPFEELNSSGLFSELQVQGLLDHIEKHGKLLSVEELQTIDAFDLLTIRSIVPYVTINSGSDLLNKGLKNILAEGKIEVTLRTQQVLEEQKGFTSAEDPDDTRYLGDNLKMYSRVRFTYKNQISVGVTAEKDAGEDFFDGTQKNGFDFYSGHVYVKDKAIKGFVLGDYQLKYGQGLVIWSGLATGKSSDVMNIKKNNTGIRPYTSVNEFSYLRGGALSIGNEKITADAFYSQRKLDASVSVTDSINDEMLIGSFTEDGYHRTQSEVDKKKQVKNTIAGGHINFRQKDFEIGYTVLNSKYDFAIEKEVKPYSQFDASGKEFTLMGVHYSYGYKNVLLFGETARSGNNAYATVNGALLAVDPRASVSISYRNYSRDYECLYCNPFRESDFANERGLYIGLTISPVNKVTWNSYVDLFSFPWLRYLVDAPSEGSEYLSQISWSPNRKSQLYIRFKHSEKAANVSNETITDFIGVVKQNNFRVNASYAISPTFTLQSRVELSNRNEYGQKTEFGSVFFQDIKFKKLGSPVSFSLRYAQFDTDSYDTRIYAFESEIPGVYAIPSYYYKGKRMYLLVQFKITKSVDFWIRYGTSIYDNQETVGSGLDEIDGNQKSDIKTQLRLVF